MERNTADQEPEESHEATDYVRASEGAAAISGTAGASARAEPVAASEPAPAPDSPPAGGRTAPGTAGRIGRRKRIRRWPTRMARRLVRLFRFIFFSSLTRRIVFLNLTALAIILSGILYLNQFREGLTEARIESLLIQGRIIAGAIAASATVETNAIRVDPEKLVEMQAGETTRPSAPSFETLDSPIKPEKVAPVLRSLIQPTRTRARIYDSEGILLLDSRHLYSNSQIFRYDLPPLEGNQEGMIARIGNTLNRWLQRRDLPIYQEQAGSGTNFDEVNDALTGAPSTVVRMTEQGEMIVSVAVPIQRYRAVLGVLQLSTQAGDIDRIVTEERIAIMRVFLVAGIVIIVLSILLAGTIASPLRKLAEAAIRVRYGVKDRVEIPDLSQRGDEIANLSQSLRDMTNALYARIEAIESFAADVSHELKNPLTSLRSAVETLPLARTQKAHGQLLDIIQHDVRRLDRLITDISDASRLDAELAREVSGPVDLRRLLENFVRSHSSFGDSSGVAIELDIRTPAKRTDGFKINGHEIRIGQVIANLIDNAKSFVPKENGRIELTMRRDGDWVEITVSDNGPGIKAERVDRIFERFYTDRPEEDSFGQNSGLGLSISRQIIEAHGGRLTARNRKAPLQGACFIVRLPVS